MYRRSGRFLRVEGDFGLDQLLARWRSSARHGCFGSGATARAGRRNGGGGEKGEAGFQVGFFFRYQQEARVGIGRVSPSTSHSKSTIYIITVTLMLKAFLHYVKDNSS